MTRTILSALAIAATLAVAPVSAAVNQTVEVNQGEQAMSFITTRDGTNIFYKDWGPKDAQPVVFH
ncbi:MAG: alpha/beta hydrolase, partial [Pseudomonadota bacterium]